MQFNTPPFAYKQECAPESLSYFILPPRAPRDLSASLRQLSRSLAAQAWARWLQHPASLQHPTSLRRPGGVPRFPAVCQHLRCPALPGVVASGCPGSPVPPTLELTGFRNPTSLQGPPGSQLQAPHGVSPSPSPGTPGPHRAAGDGSRCHTPSPGGLPPKLLPVKEA